MNNRYNNIKNIITSFALAVLMAGVSSCEKYIAIDTPPNALGFDNAFADSATATSIVLGIYSSLASGNSSIVFNNIKYGAMSADEGYYLTTFDNFKNNTLAAGNDANLLYGPLYTRIGRTNFAIEGITASNSIPATVKNQLLGEAKFLRAWLYFHLVNYFGDVPLVTSTNALETSKFGRTAAAQVYQQMVTDLTDAKTLLTPSYPSADRARINRYVASAFLSKVYLYQSKWAEAEAEATAVIGSGVYGIVTNLNNVFLSNSNETIWQISLAAASSTPATVMAVEFIPPATTPTFVLYDTLANTFEPNDQRKANWTKSIVYQGKTYYYPYKYKVRTTTTGNEYPVLIRLAELYLTRAEARARQDKVPEGIKDLNEVRGRAQISLRPLTLTRDQLLADLEHERWVELFTEDDRWYNLKRLGRANAVLSLIKPAWKPFQQLYPFPEQERTANPNLGNNPEY